MKSWITFDFHWDFFKKNWKTELLSGFILFLVALPLSIGISLASGAPPTAGLLSAIVGGVLGSLVGSGHVMINGPAAGLIVVVLTSIQELGQGDSVKGFKFTLAAIVVAGCMQLVLSIFRLGTLGLLAPVQVIHGMLASIGVTIITKQIYVLCGLKAPGLNTLDQIVALPHSLTLANFVILGIGLTTLALIVFLNFFKKGIFKFIPAPLAAVFLGIGFDKLLHLEQPHVIHTFKEHFDSVSSAFLLHVPTQLSEGISHPDWSLLESSVFWKMAFMICFVASIESVLSALAVDKIDPLGRRTDFNREIFSKGICNILLGLIGGLPIITEIVRSTLNVGNGAKTKWPCFLHGLFILLFVVVAPQVLNLIPLASFAAILIVVGFRLSHPKQLVHAHEIGREQLLLFVTTLLVSLKTDLLLGVIAGIVLKLLINIWRSRSFVPLFRLRALPLREDSSEILKVMGPAVFTNLLGLRKALMSTIHNQVTVDLTQASLVDHTVREFLSTETAYFKRSNRSLVVLFHKNHVPVGSHPLSTQVLRDENL